MKNEQVEKELQELTGIIRKKTPWNLVNEIRVYGSYNNGNWDPEKSDIDIFVEINKDDPRYITFLYEHTSKITREVLKIMKGQYKNRFSIQVYYEGLVKEIWDKDIGRGPGLGRDMKNGRLLYKKPQGLFKKLLCLNQENSTIN